MRISSSWRLPLLLSCTLGLFAGCAPAATEGGTQAGAPAGGSTSVRARSDLITREELEGSGATNLYDAIMRLRPRWLREGTNAQTSHQGGGLGLVVYQGTTHLGNEEALRQMAPGYVASVRYMDGITASNSLPGLGSRRVAGAIIIELPRS